MRTLTDREAEAAGEDRRDGHDMPDEVADYAADRWADDYWGSGI
jgi:hypothetical protein